VYRLQGQKGKKDNNVAVFLTGKIPREMPRWHEYGRNYSLCVHIHLNKQYWSVLLSVGFLSFSQSLFWKIAVCYDNLFYSSRLERIRHLSICILSRALSTSRAPWMKISLRSCLLAFDCTLHTRPNLFLFYRNHKVQEENLLFTVCMFIRFLEYIIHWVALWEKWNANALKHRHPNPSNVT
jgi:hypothetical protein